MAKQDQKQQDSTPDPQMQQKGGKSSQQQGGQVQGEGNYEAAKRYDDAQREFVKSGRVEQAARDAAPRSPQEAESMKRAEQEGKRHAKDEDPSVRGGTGGSGSESH